MLRRRQQGGTGMNTQLSTNSAEDFHLHPPAIEILSIEDNPADAKLLEELLRNSRVPNRLHVVNDGSVAIEYLLRQPPFESALTPDLILLDLNLPRIDGREVLSFIRTTPELSVIPVVVFTGSDKEEDIQESYSLRANAYIVKPFDLDSLTLAVKGIEDLWMRLHS